MGLGEFDLIEQYFSEIGTSPWVRLAVGDDAAVLDLPDGQVQLVSTDTAVLGVHFLAETPPEVIAYRTVMAAASDLAAMGAQPVGMLLALTMPEANPEWLRSFAKGLRDASGVTGLPLIGGDTTRGPLTLTVTVLGAALRERYLTRSGAQPGDRLCVSGTLGDAAAGLALLRGADISISAEHTAFLQERFNYPTARLALGLSLNGTATSAIDVSDGLLADANHLARASNVRLIIDSSLIPVSVALGAHPDPNQIREWTLRGGDDYELLFTVPDTCSLPPLATEIGRVIEGAGVSCDGAVQQTGYDHFER